MYTNTQAHNNQSGSMITAISKAVELYRTRLELSQQEFSIKCGLGRNAINEIENGKRKKPNRNTIKSIVMGINALGLKLSIEEFDAKVAEYQQSVKPEPNYTDTPYKKEETQSKRDLVNLKQHIPAAKKIVAEIAKDNKEIRFVRGVGNVLDRIERIAESGKPLDLEAFCILMKQFDSFVQEAGRKNLREVRDIFSLKSLKEKLSGFEDDMAKTYTEYKDGLIPNDWPDDNVKHYALIEEIFSEIQSRKLYLDKIQNIENRDKALNILEELEIELDLNPLHLSRINDIRARLEELDKDVFKELLITSQLLLGTYAEHLPPGSVFRDHRAAPEMVVIPPGEFKMGSPENEVGRYDDEGPQRSVTIDYPFAIGRFSVTFDEWDNFVNDVDYSNKASDEGWGRGKRPVINVSWNDAQKYVKWLSHKTGHSYHLLSEAEWEYCCRAGVEASYWWNKQITAKQANYNQTIGKTVPIDFYKPNAWGLYQMCGNVLEWCQDKWNSTCDNAPTDGSAWMSSSDKSMVRHVLRGGGHLSKPMRLRSAYRDRSRSTFQASDIGFRIARDI